MINKCNNFVLDENIFVTFIFVNKLLVFSDQILILRPS